MTDHRHDRGPETPDRAIGLSIPDTELKPHELKCRELLRGIGLLGLAVPPDQLAVMLEDVVGSRLGHEASDRGVGSPLDCRT